MRRQSLLAAAAVLVAVAPSINSAADWQGTVWNQSVSETDRDFQVPHRLPTAAERKEWFVDVEIAFDRYQAGDLEFNEGFLIFAEGKLNKIRMRLTKTVECEKLISILKRLHGTPIEEASDLDKNRLTYHDATWEVPSQNNKLMVWYRLWAPPLRNDCVLEYAPYIVPKAGDL